MKRYVRRVFSVPSHQEDDVAAELWRLGASGCETKAFDGVSPVVRIEAYFAEDLAEDFPDGGAFPGLDADRFAEVREFATETVEDRDWLAEYRAGCQPFDLGQRFRIDPRDADVSRTDDDAPTDRLVLRVPAENAFGTGSHESTRLMLEWLEQLHDRLGGWRVLDVGIGSGILSFAAELLGARHVVGFDLDAASVITARRNGERNGCRPLVAAGTAACLTSGAGFDLLLINILPERIADDLAHLVTLLRPGGRLVNSGNLVTQRSVLLPRFARLGLVLEGEQTDGEWLSWIWRRGDD